MLIEDIQIGITEIRKITNTVKEVYNFDFSHYALSSFQRRIKRFITINNISTVDKLIEHLKKDVSFVNHFLMEITVNVTEMFRDPSFWRLLRDKILPTISTHSNIHIWHAGCASGEEVFSMAILLKEFGIYDKIKITATDINENVLQKAKEGIYPLKNMDLNEENYQRFQGSSKLSDYYIVNSDKAIMDKSLLANVSFRKHDLAMAEQPFSKFDIILCRNVMIYFDKVLQDNVVKLFYESLFKNGYLVLGTKETLIWCSIADRFSVESDREKIYKMRY